MADRYLKLSCSWHDTSEWLQCLSPAGRLAWIQALVYCKSKGIKGSVKAPSLQQFARAENIPLKDINAMLKAAVDDKALVIKDGDWLFTGWSKYQGEDETNADRQKRFREKQKAENQSNSTQSVTERNGVSNANNTEEKRGEEKRKNNPLPPSAERSGGAGVQENISEQDLPDTGPVVRRLA